MTRGISRYDKQASGRGGVPEPVRPTPQTAAHLATPSATKPDLAVRYRTIVTDPPWHYDGTSVNPRKAQGKYHVFRELPYPTMTLDAIRALPVADLAERDARVRVFGDTGFIRFAFEQQGYGEIVGQEPVASPDSEQGE